MPRVPTLVALLVLCTPALAAPPAAEKRPVTDTYHGVEVIDNYRWLENPDDPDVKAWSDAQNAAARAYLDALPNAAPIRDRVREIMTAPSVRYYDLRTVPIADGEGSRLLAMRREPSKQQPVLVCFDDLSALLRADATVTPRVVIDPELLDASHSTTIDWYVPSPDGTMIAVSLSSGGTESGDVHLFTIQDSQQVHEVVPRVNGGTAGGSLAWTPDSKAFYYTRYPRAGERPEEDMDFYVQVYRHNIGEPTDKDVYEMGKDLPRIAEIVLETQFRGGYTGTVLASVQKGDGGEFIHFLRVKGSGEWTQFTQYQDRVVQGAFGPDDAVYLVSRKDAPLGKLLRMELADPKLDSAKIIVPEGTETLVDEFFEASNLLITQNLVYAVYQLGGPSEVRAFSLEGSPKSGPDQPAVSSVGGLTSLSRHGDELIFAASSFVQPTTWRTHEHGGRGTQVISALSSTSPADFSPYETVREFATSKDGKTRVPLNIVRKKGLALDGSHPTLVTGYGGYGVNIEPYFSAADIVLLGQGFVLVTANIRGGGEYGEAWHRGGNLENKQNVFDDFAAACRFMIDSKYTTPSRLAIEGGSNGGLLMGAMLTQHPDLFKAVVSHVGIYDMLRVELSSNGAFNIPEFGTVKDEKLFRAMHAYSPYHNVKDGVAYPSTLFLTGANDPRVDPMQSRKMTARLQAATSASPSSAPILLRTSGDTGHGAGTPLNERIAQTADVDAFLFHQLGVEYQPVR